MTGKHYERAMHCHKVMLESLQRLLMEQFSKQDNADLLMTSLPDDSRDRLTHLIDSPNAENLNAVLSDESITEHIKRYAKFCSEVRSGKLGKTAQLWISYMDHFGLVLSLIEAVKVNNFQLYSQCISQMSDLFFSFGAQNYARYTTFFSVFIANIETSHPGAEELLERGAISVARSFIPGNRCDVDKTMEETFMRHAKSHGGGGTGISGIMTNYSAYQRWVRTTHARSQYVNATLSMANMLADSGEGMKHRDVRPTEILRSEKNVVKTCEAIESFLNPFDVETKDKLLILSSGAAASDDVVKDVLAAENLGRRAKEAFIIERLQTDSKFFEPVKRMNLRTLGSMNKVSIISSGKQKVIQYKQQGNVAFKLFMKSQNEGLQLDLKELMTYPLTPVSYSLGTSDGFLAKTDKSKAFHHLTKECENAIIPPENDTLTVHDGNACFYYLKDLPGSFSEICSKVFDTMSNTHNVIFSTDMYLPTSVKAMERKRRGVGNKLIIKGGATKKPPDWKQFLSNDENKLQFIQMLLRLWRTDEYASKLHGRNVILICDGVPHKLTSEDGTTTSSHLLDSMTSSQEETDSRIILYCEYAQSKNFNYVRVKSPDTDVFFILLHYAHRLADITVLFDTGTGNKKKLINISELAHNYSHEYCTALMALHAFCGCDTTSAFRGIGKVKPMKTLLKIPRYVPVLAQLGDTWDIPSQLLDDLEAFTCAIYGRPRVLKVDDLRLLRINELCARDEILTPSQNIDMATLPPCRRSLLQHIARVNYQVGIWKRAHIPKPDVPLAHNGHGWTQTDEHLEPLWYDGTMLPAQLSDLARTVAPGTVNDDDNDDDDDDDDDALMAENSTLDGDETDSDIE
uniref:uncharacterized protein n=3 Tax=Myxine glutinosa TaxID=7769 RepID=UPI00358E53D5